MPYKSKASSTKWTLPKSILFVGSAAFVALAGSIVLDARRMNEEVSSKQRDTFDRLMSRGNYKDNDHVECLAPNKIYLLKDIDTPRGPSRPEMDEMLMKKDCYVFGPAD